MDLLHKLRAIESRLAMFEDAAATPGLTVIEGVLGPCEVIVQGRPTLMFGSNNYLGLTKHPDVVDAARRALDDYGTGTTGSRTANGTFALHEALERDFAEWFGKRHAIIFSTGYQANLSLIGGLCGAGDVILIDSDSHASIYDATRQTPSQVIGFRHNSADSLRRKLERLPRGERNRLVVVEGLYSIRGDVAPLLDIANICSANGAYLLVDEAHSSTASISSSAPSRNRSRASVASACRTIPNCARSTSWRARTSSPRQGRRPTSRAWRPRSASSGSIPSCASGCGRTSARCAAGCATSATRSAKANRQSFRF
ncbi:MAG: hypothetical protein DMG03_05895 [Acidobacteria bacterium]|nr:MAG: hypothetical protein DMG03_05895 [Acidobacteriota bacterium]